MTTFDWRAHLKVHPARELFPPLPPAELKELADDLIKNGQRVQLAVLGNRTDDIRSWTLLDGRNRLDALALAGALDIKNRQLCCPPANRYLEIRFMDSDCDPYAMVLGFNIHRRHLTAEQKRELIAKLLKAKPEQSDRTVAKQVKVDHKTVGGIRKDCEARGEIPHVDKRTDAKGREQPATKPDRPKKVAEPKHEPSSVRCPCPLCADQHTPAPEPTTPAAPIETPEESAERRKAPYAEPPAASAADRRTYCSFCGKSDSEVKVLIAGSSKTVFICNECVDRCAEMIRGKAKAEVVKKSKQSEKLNEVLGDLTGAILGGTPKQRMKRGSKS